MSEIDLNALKTELMQPKLSTDQCNARIEALSEALSRLTDGQVAQTLREYYRQDVYFKDPFNETRGLPKLIQIWQDRFRRLPDAQLRCHLHACNGDTAYIEWRLIHSEGGRPVQRNGISKLLLDENGKVRVQMDYWDSGEHFYQRLPLIGGLMRWLADRQRAN